MTGGDGFFDLARSGGVAGLHAAFDRGASVNSRNENGDSLVMLAAYHGREAVVRLLLERGADANAANHKGQTPLAGACFKGVLGICRALLDHGAHVEAGDGAHQTPLMLAAMGGHTAIVELLLANGARPMRTCANGSTALDVARKKRIPSIVKMMEAAAGPPDVPPVS